MSFRCGCDEPWGRRPPSRPVCFSSSQKSNPHISLGAYLFSRSVLPLLLSAVTATPPSKYPPTLLFTGATASIRGSAQTSSFATGKFALRALSQSLAKEFGPQGVHVAHAIIDGVIDIPKTKGWVFEKEDAKIDANAVSFLFFLPFSSSLGVWGFCIPARGCATWTDFLMGNGIDR